MRCGECTAPPTPGIAWLMTPLAVFGDTRYAMAAARIVTAIVAGVNASLAAYALRANGRVAMLTAGLALAVFPLAVSADHTLTLDPYLVLFCLLGTVIMFSGRRARKPSQDLACRRALRICRRCEDMGVLSGDRRGLHLLAAYGPLPFDRSLRVCCSASGSRASLSSFLRRARSCMTSSSLSSTARQRDRGSTPWATGSS